MQHDERRRKIATLLLETERAHCEACEAGQDEDREWPIWYAGHLQEPLGELLGREFTRSKIAACMMQFETERKVREPGAAWAEFYAEHLLECFAPSEAPAEDHLALYFFPSCPYCVLVQRAIGHLKLDVELRDIHDDGQHWDDLIEARGTSTVPVLRITAPGGEERWMPESRDIVRYLVQTYGEPGPDS